MAAVAVQTRLWWARSRYKLKQEFKREFSKALLQQAVAFQDRILGAVAVQLGIVSPAVAVQRGMVSAAVAVFFSMHILESVTKIAVAVAVKPRYPPVALVYHISYIISFRVPIIPIPC